MNRRVFNLGASHSGHASKHAISRAYSPGNESLSGAAKNIYLNKNSPVKYKHQSTLERLLQSKQNEISVIMLKPKSPNMYEVPTSKEKKEIFSELPLQFMAIPNKYETNPRIVKNSVRQNNNSQVYYNNNNYSYHRQYSDSSNIGPTTVIY